MLGCTVTRGHMAMLLQRGENVSGAVALVTFSCCTGGSCLPVLCAWVVVLRF